MKANISMHLGGSSKSHLVMAKTIICILLASLENITSSRFVIGVLGVDCRNFAKGVNRRVQLDLKNKVF